MKYTIAFILTIIAFSAQAQTNNEWMVLKKKDYTVKTYFPGNYIRFQLDNYQWIEGDIKFFRNDSIFLMQRSERIGITSLGLPVRDTVELGILAYRVNEIYALPMERTGIGIVESGTLFQILGGGYIFLNAVNSLILSQPFFAAENMAKVGIAAGVFMVGKIMQWNHPTKVVLGKKYKLQSIKVNTEQ